jgi:hypothetical protein
MSIIYVPQLVEEHKFRYVPRMAEECKFVYVPRFWAEERKVRYVPQFRPRNVSSHMFLGWPRNISSYVPQCHVAEEHKLCSSALMSMQSYVCQDIFLSYSYVPRPPTYVPQFLAEEHMYVSCSA